VGRVSSPKMMLQINAEGLQVDNTKAALALEHQRRSHQVSFLASLEQEKNEMRAGTSSWFGNHQLQNENARLISELSVNSAALAPKLAAAEAALGSAADHEAAFSIPHELPVEREQLKAMAHDANKLVAKVRELEEKRQAFELVPEELPAIDAELIPLKARAAAQTSDVHAKLTALYQTTRAEHPALADRWLEQHATIFRKPDAAALTELLRTQRSLEATFEINTSDLERLNAQHSENAPKKVEQLSASIVAAHQHLAEIDVTLAGFRDGTVKSVAAFTTAYPQHKSFI
jgi:hypothetical protein